MIIFEKLHMVKSVFYWIIFCDYIILIQIILKLIENITNYNVLVLADEFAMRPQLLNLSADL